MKFSATEKPMKIQNGKKAFETALPTHDAFSHKKLRLKQGKSKKIVCLCFALTTCEIVGENARCNDATVAVENRL